ncbi:hypothetical protein [Levilactobacillus brevis]|uniref:hypothetical protein n=1 Tax=Levilactobacillus brevis TaxID=1580 RepID=UPI0020CF2F64|nr:hypothetical protein [Levilactobacillus brevis]MCP9615127.1 hypothetical protein [Levilactobacillus brevis]
MVFGKQLTGALIFYSLNTHYPHTESFGNLILINISGLPWNELQGFTPLRLPHIAGYGFAGIVLEGRLV